MLRTQSMLMLLPALALAGCVTTNPMPESSTVLVAPSQPEVALTAPVPPPPPQTELVPPPPTGSGPVVWQPGHWTYTGTSINPWTWVAGHYVTPPYGQTTWIPGQWQRTPAGAWVWVSGHWA
jgi:hypothetical protein